MSQTKWVAIKNGRGEVKGWIEMFWCRSLNDYVTIPGVSRWQDGAK